MNLAPTIKSFIFIKCYGEDFIDRCAGWNTRYTFSAKEKDDKTGYHYFGARYYDSERSQFISVDPAGRRYPGESDYSYAGNNPVMFIDFNGLFKLPKGFRKKYPKAAHFLDFYVHDYVKNMGSPCWVPLVDYGEFKNRGNLLETLKMGQGPFIIAKESLVDDVWPKVRWAAGRYITEDEKDLRENKKKEPEIWINEDVLNYFENAKTRKEKLIARLMLVSTVLHENTHYGDMKDGKDGSYCGGCEVGVAIEEELYPQNLAGGEGLEAMKGQALKILKRLMMNARVNGYGRQRIPTDKMSKMPTKDPVLIDTESEPKGGL